MVVLFYLFVVLGLLIYIYFLFAFLVNKKREKLLSEVERDYTRQKFKKCPHCGVLNDREARVCQYCKKGLPGLTAAGKPSKGTPQVPEAEKDLTTEEGEKAPKAPKPSAPVPDMSHPDLEKFPYKNVWPMPHTQVFITFTSVYLGVIFVFAFFMGVYKLGKAGVEQLNEVSREAARRQAEKSAHHQSPSQVPSASAQKSSEQLPVRTPTPLPSTTPFQLEGSREDQINQLMVYLENEDWNVAVRAKKRLIEIGKPAAPALEAEIDHPDAMVRTHVITALGEIGSQESIPALIRALKHDDKVTVIQAANALGGIGGDEALQALKGSLKHPDWRVRRAAITSLGKIRDPSVVEDVKPFLEDENERVQEAAREVLQFLKAPTVKE